MSEDNVTPVDTVVRHADGVKFVRITDIVKSLRADQKTASGDEREDVVEYIDNLCERILALM